MTSNIDSQLHSNRPIDYERLDPSNLDFDPKEVVGRLPTNPKGIFWGSFITTTVLLTGLSAGVFVAGDVMVGESVADNQEDIAAAEKEASTEAEAGLEYDLNLDGTIEDIGEGCVALFYRYAPAVPGGPEGAGRLANVSENVMVQDLLNTPGTPCSDRPSDIRNDFRAFSHALNQKDSSRQRLVSKREDIEEQEAQSPGIEADQNDQQWPNGIALALIPAMAIGALIGREASYDDRRGNRIFIHSKLDGYLKTRNGDREVDQFWLDYHSYRFRGDRSPFSKDQDNANQQARKVQLQRNDAVEAIIGEHYKSYKEES